MLDEMSYLEKSLNVKKKFPNLGNKDGPQYTIKHDGDYLLIIHMESDAGNSQLLDSTITIR